MYGTYLRRELIGRRKQTIIVALGLAIAVALVVVINALSAGVRGAQEESLQSVTGIGTDLTVAGAAAAPGEGGGPRFEFDAGAGETSDGTTSLSQSRLTTDPRRGSLESSAVATIEGIDGVSAAAGTLSLENTTFSGEIPDMSAGTGATGESGSTGDLAQGAPPQGGQGGPGGGGNFGIDSVSVMGVGLDSLDIGPLSAVTVDAGRALAASDAGATVTLLDSAYAETESIAVGDSVDFGGTAFEVVGLVSSSTSSADTAADSYIPLDVAQELSGAGDVVSTVYVQATSAGEIATVQENIAEALPDATVNSQEELAAQVSGSLSSTVGLITSLGTWLSIIALAVAVLLAALFTLSGVSRRTREFGTLKAIGWSNRRIVGQVAGESLVQAAIGGVLGLVLGGLAVGIVNLIAPTISTASDAASSATSGPPEMSGGGMPDMSGGGMPDMPGGAGGMNPGGTAQATADIVLNAPLTPWILLTALGLAIVGGLIAGALGGIRASRLSPAEALRAVN